MWQGTAKEIALRDRCDPRVVLAVVQRVVLGDSSER